MPQSNGIYFALIYFHDLSNHCECIKQQQPQPAGTPAPTYVNRNVINSETPYINASLQPFEKPHYVSINAAEVNFI